MLSSTRTSSLPEMLGIGSSLMSAQPCQLVLPALAVTVTENHATHLFRDLVDGTMEGRRGRTISPSPEVRQCGLELRNARPRPETWAASRGQAQTRCPHHGAFRLDR